LKERRDQRGKEDARTTPDQILHHRPCASLLRHFSIEAGIATKVKQAGISSSSFCNE
jgi:hypothetical protein